VPTNELDRYSVTCKVCQDVKQMKQHKNYKWQKNEGTGTMPRNLRSKHGLGLEGEESNDEGQAELHGYASDMPGVGMPFVYNRERMITECGKFVIADELPFSFGESPNYEYFNRVALQSQYRRVPRNTLKRHTQQGYYAYRECIKIICTIKQTCQANPNPSVKDLLDNMNVKWCAYFNEFPPIYAITAILDPGVKLQGLTNLVTFYYEQFGVNFDVPYYVNKCKLILESLCEDYGVVIQPQPVGSAMGTSRFGFLGPILLKQRPD
ncbi:Plexin-A4, partial [Bienertia sinuspersici]